MKFTLNRRNIDIILASKIMTITELSKEYGCSRARMNAILNSRKVTPMCVGRLAKALDVDVTEIIEQ